MSTVPSSSSVAVCPLCSLGMVLLVHVSDTGSNRSASWSVSPPFCPPATRTRPPFTAVAVWFSRGLVVIRLGLPGVGRRVVAVGRGGRGDDAVVAAGDQHPPVAEHGGDCVLEGPRHGRHAHPLGIDEDEDARPPASTKSWRVAPSTRSRAATGAPPSAKAAGAVTHIRAAPSSLVTSTASPRWASVAPAISQVAAGSPSVMDHAGLEAQPLLRAAGAGCPVGAGAARERAPERDAAGPRVGDGLLDRAHLAPGIDLADRDGRAAGAKHQRAGRLRRQLQGERRPAPETATAGRAPPPPAPDGRRGSASSATAASAATKPVAVAEKPVPVWSTAAERPGNDASSAAACAARLRPAPPSRQPGTSASSSAGGTKETQGG